VPKVTPASGSEPASVSYEEANLLLEVTPSIVGDGNIVLEIKLNWDVPDDSKAVQGNPYITQRVIETELLVPNKAVVVIGGIKKQETADAEDKVPGLGDLPFIGQLFRKARVKDNRTELLVFISPRVI
jgi:type IV pilus assembly protein PilQ